MHTPARMYGFIRDLVPPQSREDLRETVTEKYLSLQTLERERFQSIKNESDALAPSQSSLRDALSEAKLHELNSKEIPCGFKLTPTTSPTDVDTFKTAFEQSVDRRKDWHRIMTVKVPDPNAKSNKKKVSYSILHHYRKIDKKVVVKTNFHTTKSMKSASVSMYDALCASMNYKFRLEMKLHEDSIANQGPRLLWFLLTRLSLRADKVVANFQKEIW